jgi:hypothetical protein
MDISSIENEGKYYCTYCSSKFSSKKILLFHMKTNKECINSIQKEKIGEQQDIESDYNKLLHKYKLLKKDIKEKEEKIRELQTELNSKKKRPYNNVVIACGKPLLLNEEIVYDRMKNNFKKGDILNDGQLALWFLKNICTNEEGKVCIQCTDLKRKVFKYIDDNDIIQVKTKDDIMMLITGCKNKIEDELNIKLKVSNKFVNKLSTLTYIERVS